jgi:hypothetical protein
MEAIDYEELLIDQGVNFNKIDQFKEYLRLKDIARNLESLGRLVDAEAKERELETSGQHGNEV